MAHLVLRLSCALLALRLLTSSVAAVPAEQHTASGDNGDVSCAEPGAATKGSLMFQARKRGARPGVAKVALESGADDSPGLTADAVAPAERMPPQRQQAAGGKKGRSRTAKPAPQAEGLRATAPEGAKAAVRDLSFFQVGESSEEERQGEVTSPLPAVASADPGVVHPEQTGPYAAREAAANGEALPSLEVAPARGPEPFGSDVEAGQNTAVAPGLTWPEAEIASAPSVGLLQMSVVHAVLAVLALCALLAGVQVIRGRRHGASAVRARAEQVRVTTGGSLQGLEEVGNGPFAKPLSPGLLMRIEGRVAPKAGQGCLSAPLSGRPCVLYSASVSHDRHDGVHQPPVAFHSAGVDFSVELSLPDALEPILVGVHSHDAALFDMTTGRYAFEQTLAEAPDALRGFVLAHLTSGSDVSSQVVNRVDPEGIEGVLEFRECALVAGGMVTVIGEIARERDGGLQLYPWRPPSSAESAPGSDGAEPWLATSWESPWEAKKAAVQRDPLVGRVMVSDDASLFVGDYGAATSPPPPSSWRRCMTDGPRWWPFGSRAPLGWSPPTDHPLAKALSPLQEVAATQPPL
mmetsp:Transcript_58754/g.129096  ORF Transcript_58754/g.129096 Transcript_58754/m.129096 type:complete len:577 (-) Transcript_58754:158-1888(-)